MIHDNFLSSYVIMQAFITNYVASSTTKYHKLSLGKKPLSVGKNPLIFTESNDHCQIGLKSKNNWGLLYEKSSQNASGVKFHSTKTYYISN